MHQLATDQIANLQRRFADLINYEGDDAVAPIDPLTYKEPGGDSLIHIAAFRGDGEAVALLLGAGVDPDTRGDMGYTPLHYAAANGDRRVADILISHGASADAINEFGKTPDLSGF